MPSPIYWTLVHRSQVPPDRLKGFLSDPEFLKLSTLRFPKRRDEWLLGRWAAKCLVHSVPAYRQYALDEIQIQNAPEGAPYIQPSGEAVSPDCLSISHSDPFALCALSSDPGIRIGVDLERIEPRPASFIEDYFTNAEQELVSACPAERRMVLVNLIWSAKESMLKALGVGLRRDTRSVEVHQVDGLLPGGHKWHKLDVREAGAAQRSWAAWWQRRGDFVITLAGFTTKQPGIQSTHLVEKKMQAG